MPIAPIVVIHGPWPMATAGRPVSLPVTCAMIDAIHSERVSTTLSLSSCALNAGSDQVIPSPGKVKA